MKILRSKAALFLRRVSTSDVNLQTVASVRNEISFVISASRDSNIFSTNEYLISNVVLAVDEIFVCNVYVFGVEKSQGVFSKKETFSARPEIRTLPLYRFRSARRNAISRTHPRHPLESHPVSPSASLRVQRPEGWILRVCKCNAVHLQRICAYTRALAPYAFPFTRAWQKCLYTRGGW